MDFAGLIDELNSIASMWECKIGKVGKKQVSKSAWRASLEREFYGGGEGRG